MWVLRVINQKQSNQLFLLKDGIQIIGRDSVSDIVFLSSGISKKHAEIEVKNNQVMIRDLNSKNGIAVNGHRVKETQLKDGDKILFYNLMVELNSLNQQPKSFNPSFESDLSKDHLNSNQKSLSLKNAISSNDDLAVYENQGEAHAESTNKSLESFEENFSEEKKIEEENNPEGTKEKKSIFLLLNEYINKAFLPGIYKLVEWTSFKGALGILIILFIFCFTFFSFLPVLHFFESQALSESKLRAITIAKSIAKINKDPILTEMESSASVAIAENEKGVQKAIIVSSRNGLIISPALLAGKYPKIPFLSNQLKQNKESIHLTKNQEIIAIAPINFYDPDLNILKPLAQVAVVYNFKTLSLGGNQKINLFIQSFLISLLAGFILLFLIIKLSEYPIQTINQQIDNSLKNQDSHQASNIELPHSYPVLEKLVSNINSVLSRMVDQENSVENSMPMDRNQEMEDLIELIGFPASTVLIPENKFGAINNGFAEKLNSNPSELLNTSVDNVTDQALKLSLLDLLESVQNNSNQMALNKLDINGIQYEIIARSIFGSRSIAYVLIVFVEYGEETLDEEQPLEEGEYQESDMESA